MHISHGTYRIVFIFPRQGFVVKLPKLLVRSAFATFIYYLKEKSFGMLKKYLSHGIDVEQSFKNFIFKGIKDNYHESLFYRKSSTVFPQPTRFSLLGLITIQDYGIQHEIPPKNLFLYFMKLTDGEAIQDRHHFTHWRNFCFVNGKIRIVDYGNPTTQKLIEKWGDKIVAEFDLEKVLSAQK